MDVLALDFFATLLLCFRVRVIVSLVGCFNGLDGFWIYSVYTGCLMTCRLVVI